MRPTENFVVIQDFEKWMGSMDGGSHTPDICMKARFVVKNLLDVISIEDIMDLEKVCKYFTDKQMKKELSVGSTSVYIRYFSNFALHMRQKYNVQYSLEAYSNVMQRIERYVSH